MSFLQLFSVQPPNGKPSMKVDTELLFHYVTIVACYSIWIPLTLIVTTTLVYRKTKTESGCMLNFHLLRTKQS
ncbi:hypothetical protein D3C86_2031450 [compost metagenome]